MPFDPKLGATLVSSPATPKLVEKHRVEPGEPVQPAHEEGGAITAPAPIEPPHRFKPIPWSRKHFPLTNLCGCGQEVPREWQPVDSFWRTAALSLGHGHCPHELGYGRCPYEEQEEAARAARQSIGDANGGTQ
jgi:hypothetical protein